MTADENEIVVYQPDETVRLDVRLDGDTVWLTQNQMTDLFQRDRTVITRHTYKQCVFRGRIGREKQCAFFAHSFF